MIYLTQLIYVHPGEESVFQEFEALVLPLLQLHNGSLLLRLRPDESAYVSTGIEKPYEIHLVEFAEDEDFKNYLADETRKNFLHLKDQSIRSAWVIKGEKL